MTGSEYLQTDTFPIPAGATASVPWTHMSGDRLLKLTDPGNPVIKTKSIYIITATVTFLDGSQPGRHASINVGGPVFEWTTPLDLDAHGLTSGYPMTTLTGADKWAAGGSTHAIVAHTAPATLNVSLAVSVQKVSQ